MKIAIVTGVLGGIGKESALQLCKNGYAVVGMDVMKTKSSYRTLPLIPQVEEALLAEKEKAEQRGRRAASQLDGKIPFHRQRRFAYHVLALKIHGQTRETGGKGA